MTGMNVALEKSAKLCKIMASRETLKTNILTEKRCAKHPKAYKSRFEKTYPSFYEECYGTETEQN